MNKKIATIKALIEGDISIERILKTPVRKTPGDVTDVAHN
jgi:hypothetical protein